MKPEQDTSLADSVGRLVSRMLSQDSGQGGQVAALCRSAVLAVGQGHSCMPLPDGEEGEAARAALLSAPAVVYDASDGGDPEASGAPFVLDGNRLYTRRNHRCERHILKRLRAMEERGLFGILSGGPGTGKTYTLARMVLSELRANPELRLSLAAPTGKAAARMKESLAAAFAEATGGENGAPELSVPAASTLHSLLGANPVTGRFGYGPDKPIPADWVVVDEASMVDLLLFGHLLDALAPDARLTLVGDPDQLVSVERGSVLRDLCDGGHPVERLTVSRRFPADGAIARFAAAVNGGDGDGALELLRSGLQDLRWHDCDNVPESADLKALDGFRDAVRESFAAFAAASEPAEALRRLADCRILCAVRQGPRGVSRVNEFARSVLPKGSPVPIMAVANDDERAVRNGDLAVVFPSDPDTAWFEPLVPGAPPRAIPRAVLPEHEPAWATTVHKSQGSEFGHVLVLLPRADNPLLTREMLYTAVTRTRRGVTLWSTSDAVRACAARRVSRATGLASVR